LSDPFGCLLGAHSSGENAVVKPIVAAAQGC
jgi:hypothetical protein